MLSIIIYYCSTFIIIDIIISCRSALIIIIFQLFFALLQAFRFISNIIEFK